MEANRSRLWRLRAMGGLELMRAHYHRHAFARHGHETFAIGVVLSGAEEIWFREGVERVGPGGLVLIEPEVVHTGVASDANGWAYRVLYPSARVMADIAGGPGTPRFRQRLVHDREAAALVLTAHAAAETEDPLTAETLLRSALRHLLRAHGDAPEPVAPVPGGGFTAQAREVLRERLTDPPGLQELAAQVGVAPFTLVRAFRAAYGLPPHAFLIQQRVRAARRLLRDGMPPAEVAPEVGFFDQAHLTRHFRRLVGVPPGAYQRPGKIVQASGRASP
ncbi:AraC family transcriptional regulator [Spirillospora sp. CA-294931]|uniref:AraC family transcriptional regulator n=1 Tax=Spirillospora sp. CA-294931 TaxID=3240042 RepID=UPI003D8D45CA